MKLISQIKEAEKPVLLIGEGVRDYQDILYKLIDKLQIPVMTTWRSLDLIEQDHPLFAGRPGIKSQPEANKMLSEATLVLCIGTRLHVGQRGYDGEFVPNAEVIVVDIDVKELCKTNYNTLPYNAEVFMEDLYNERI